MVKLSVIIPVYNASEYLENSIDSILHQTIDEIEIICVNDGSTDNSLKILENFSKDYKFINIINQENSGPGKARNVGIQEAKGKYIAFLDADDIFLDNNALKLMYDYAIENDANMVAGNLMRVKQDGTIEDDYDYENMMYSYFKGKSVIKPEEYGIPWAFYKNIYKKDFLIEKDITFPDLLRGQDPIFLAKVLTNINNIYAIDVDLYGYNHTVSGGVNMKVNNYSKKKDYIQHFLDTFEILKVNNFNVILSKYKVEFVNYINFRNNMDDKDIIKIINDSDSLLTYFNESDYGFLIIDSIINQDTTNLDEDYNLIKECLFEESMIEEVFIDVDRLKIFANMGNNDINNLINSFKILKQIETYTFEDKRIIKGQVERLKKDITHFIHSNDQILNSNSWKVTEYLRNIKHKL